MARAGLQPAGTGAAPDRMRNLHRLLRSPAAEKPALLALPGVGPYTAAAIRVFAFDLPDVFVETNIRTVIHP